MNVILERVQDGLHIVDNKGCLHSPWREILHLETESMAGIGYFLVDGLHDPLSEKGRGKSKKTKL